MQAKVVSSTVPGGVMTLGEPPAGKGLQVRPVDAKALSGEA